MVRRFIFMFKMNKAIIELGSKKNIYLSERQMILLRGSYLIGIRLRF